MTEEDKLDPWIKVGCVVKCKASEWGRIEQFISSLFGAEVLFVKKAKKGTRLTVEGGEKNARFSP